MSMEYLQIEQLEVAGIYEIRSRNLVVGVYDGEEGFIGVREKMGAEYLFTEYLNRESGGTKVPIDTVRPIRLLGNVPQDMPIRERGDVDTRCDTCGKRAWWTGPPKPAPWACEGGCEKTSPRATENEQLFALLKTYEEELG